MKNSWTILNNTSDDFRIFGCLDKVVLEPDKLIEVLEKIMSSGGIRNWYEDHDSVAWYTAAKNLPAEYLIISFYSKAAKQNYEDNYKWIKDAAKNKLVVGSQARILYTDMQVCNELQYTTFTGYDSTYIT